MSEDNFTDSTSIFHILTAVLVMFAAPLLPMVAGWFTLLSN